jgi:hypothetical protein
MGTMKKILPLIFYFSIIHLAQAQNDIPIGTWRTHLNYSQAKTLTLADNKIFIATGHSVFFLDIEDGSLNKLTKSDGLREVNVSAVGYESISGNLILGAVNGNIDMIRGNRIYNIRAITNSPIVTSKRINSLVFHNGFAYASTDFGIPVIDLNKREIKETYFPGFDGNPLKINGATIYQNSLFIASEQGIMAGSLNPQVNLIDFRNWKRFNAVDGIPVIPFVSVVNFNNKVYAASEDGVYVYENAIWESIDLDIGEEIKSLSVSHQEVVITLQSKIMVLSEDHSATIIDHPLINKPNFAIRDQSGIFWIADLEHGLVTNQKGAFVSVHPSGPSENIIHRVKSVGDKIIAIPRGRSESGAPLGKHSSFFVFEKGQWTNFLPYEKTGTNKLPAIKDLVDFTHNPIDKKTYFASFGEGLLVWDGANFEIINSSSPQSTLVNSFITSVNVDSGVLWMINHNQNPALHSLANGNVWKSYSTGSHLAPLASDFMIYENGDKWLYSNKGSTGGIIVYNEENNQTRLLTTRSNEGNLSSNSINKLVTDREGSIWAATINGVVYFSDPRRVLSDGANATSPIYEGFRLFFGENINTIAVDGANRKWIGTHLGLWLFNESGTRLIHHFTTENSPLLSNEILDIDIHHGSGEIFIATSMGLVSFRGTATAPDLKHQNVVIFPNPVGPGFNGVVGISGLVEHAQVKITDISGKLIWETRSHGGSATWKVTDYNGRRAASGVYLIFSSDDSGTETFVGKIAVVN